MSYTVSKCGLHYGIFTEDSDKPFLLMNDERNAALIAMIIAKDDLVESSHWWNGLFGIIDFYDFLNEWNVQCQNGGHKI
jgi:hypothetical protein